MLTFVNSGSREFALSWSVSSVCPIFSRLTFIVRMEALREGRQASDCFLCAPGSKTSLANQKDLLLECWSFSLQWDNSKLIGSSKRELAACKNIINATSSKETTFICHTFITTCRHGSGRKTLPSSCAGCKKQCGVLDNLLDLALHQSVNLDPVARSHTFFVQKIQDTLCNGSSGADTQKYWGNAEVNNAAGLVFTLPLPACQDLSHRSTQWCAPLQRPTTGWSVQQQPSWYNWLWLGVRCRACRWCGWVSERGQSCLCEVESSLPPWRDFVSKSFDPGIELSCKFFHWKKDEDPRGYCKQSVHSARLTKALASSVVLTGTLDGQLASNRNCSNASARDVLASPLALIPTKLCRLWKPVRNPLRTKAVQIILRLRPCLEWLEPGALPSASEAKA